MLAEYGYTHCKQCFFLFLCMIENFKILKRDLRVCFVDAELNCTILSDQNLFKVVCMRTIKILSKYSFIRCFKIKSKLFFWLF